MPQKYSILILFLVLHLRSYAQDSVLVIHNDMEEIRTDYPWINQNTFIKGLAYSGESFSRTDSSNLYGIGWKGTVPELFLNKNICIQIWSQARLIGSTGKASLVFSILKEDSVIYWENRSINDRVKLENTWTSIKDSISIPKNLSGPEYTLLIYLWNEEGKVICDLDSVSFKFTEVKLNSYLVPFDTLQVLPESSDFFEAYSGKYFKMLYNKISGQFKVLDSNDKTLLHSFSLYTSWSESVQGEMLNKENTGNIFFLRGDVQTEQGKMLTLESRFEIGDTKVMLIFSDESPNFNFHFETGFNVPVLLRRQSFSASFIPELTEVYRNSSLIDTVKFEEEYWLGKGGFQAFSDRSGIIIYHNEGISSLQLNPRSKRFTANLDWEMDHPLLHWPLLSESENIKLNHSSGIFQKGSVLKGDFVVHAIRESKKIPRLTKVSGGRSAAIIWTEHADYSDLALQRAVNFGSDKINKSSQATGGFIKYKIPVTKSVFYSNPDAVFNSVKAGFIKTKIASIKGTPGFKGFLEQLQNEGQEICLHTPDQFTTNKLLLEEALKSTQKDFNGVTWIDHGYDNGIKSNRENLVCDGLDESSPYGAISLWEKYGIKYFWNCFYEDTNLYSSLAFNSFMTVPYSGWGDRFPVPDYWRHPSRSRDLIHWRTTGTLDPPSGNMWNYYFSDGRLNDLINTRAVSVLHVYPARSDSSNGFYEEVDGHFQIQESFEKVLQKQALLRDSGQLRVLTIQDHLNYQLALEKIDIQFVEDGNVRVENLSSRDIDDISFVTTASSILIEGKTIHTRMKNGETFFWFNLNKGEVVMIELK